MLLTQATHAEPNLEKGNNDVGSNKDAIKPLSPGEEKALSLLETWVNQLNDAVRVTVERQNPDEMVRNSIVFSQRLVYGIDNELEVLDGCKLSVSEKAGLDQIMNNMTPSAFGIYQQTSLRWRAQHTGNTSTKQRDANSIAKVKGAASSAGTVLQGNLKEEIQIPAYLKSFEVKPSDQKIYSLSADDLQHGREQVELMIHDRPEMARYVRKGDAVWNWTARQFAGECTGKRYFWAQDATAGGAPDGWHSVPYLGDPGIIAVIQTSPKPRDGDELWAIAIFELLNTRNDPAFIAWHRHAEFGKISQHEHVKQTVWLEFVTAKQTRSFYEGYWVAHCKKMNLRTNGVHWYAGLNQSFQKWFDSQPKDSPYFKHLGGY